jgi:hypothetical protein
LSAVLKTQPNLIQGDYPSANSILASSDVPRDQLLRFGRESLFQKSRQRIEKSNKLKRSAVAILNAA